ncbi:MAG TPA: hypothetical protein VLM40_09760, partial [Gemmata sp.]|nr:hypothetical protein [Gemmata sp.]
MKHGLARIRSHPSLGLRALMVAAGMVKDAEVTSEDVGYRLAPRLNAAGRLGCAMMSIELLTTRTPHIATFKKNAAHLSKAKQKIFRNNYRPSLIVTDIPPLFYLIPIPNNLKVTRQALPLLALRQAQGRL